MRFCPFRLNLDFFEVKGIKTIKNEYNHKTQREEHARRSEFAISVPLVLCFSTGIGHYQTAGAEKFPDEAEAPCLTVPLSGTPPTV